MDESHDEVSHWAVTVTQATLNHLAITDYKCLGYIHIYFSSSGFLIKSANCASFFFDNKCLTNRRISKTKVRLARYGYHLRGERAGHKGSFSL